jgi:hypothetical protein
MDIRMIVAIILAVAWLLWSVLPVLPGVVLSMMALVIVEFATPVDLSTQVWVVSIILTILALASDYLLPIRWARKSWGTKWSTYGSIIWLILWLFVPPRGLLIWPLLGAYVWEYIMHQDSRNARRAARGSFVWSILSSVIKLIAAWVILYYVIIAW